MNPLMPMRFKNKPSILGLKGFTLIELMVVVAVAAVLVTLAVPSFDASILSNRLGSFANSFVAAAQVARGEALKRNAPVRLCRSANGTSCATSGGWEQGWIVFADTNNNAVVDTGETVVQIQQAIPTGYQLTGDTYSIAFQSLGDVSPSANLVLCRKTPLGSQERRITISAIGRTAVTTEKTGVCT